MSQRSRHQAQLSRHVSKRTGLPPEIRQHLIPLSRELWSKHKGYSGKASFFIEYHQNIINNLSTIQSQLTRSLDHSNQSGIQRLIHQTKQLLKSLDHHHKIEDQMYFPYFKQNNRNLINAVELLEKDHKSVEQKIHQLHKLLTKLELYLIKANKTYPFALMVQFFEAVQEFEKMIRRHLFDEEEIIIPIFILDKSF
ncbi:MAG: hemerythrin domain-containing protein [Saccharospirillaceae bacterium]|nr:hemerythrin domain-containing protein [Pseudomonadales bacterium]NRB77916.1 hemerythrin domain-containing protein [Saccharospirillaceae bacterium]